MSNLLSRFVVRPMVGLTVALATVSTVQANPFEVRIPFKSMRASATVPTPSEGGVSLSALALDFGDVQMGKSATLSLTVANAGKAAAAVSDIWVTQGAALFTRTHNCGSSLAASSSCKVDVAFSPLEEGAAQGVLQVSIGNLAQEVSLDGKGIAPVANATVWTPFAMPVSAYWRDISYGNGVFVSTDASISGKSAYSSDGITWQAGNMPRAGSWTTAYGDGKFVAAGWGSNGTWSATSADGKSWVLGGTPPIASEHISYSNGVYVASAQMQNQNPGLVARSTDGVTWSKVSLPFNGQFMGAAAGGGKFVLVAPGTQALLSSDGLIWTTVSMPVNSLWISVTYGNGRFVAVAQGSANASAVSTDGVNWIRGTLPAQFSAGDVIYGNGKFVASGTSGKTLQSVDGLNWTQNTMPSASVWYALGFGNGRFVTLGNNSNQGAYTQ